MNLLKLFSLTTSLFLLSQVAFAVQPAPKECPSLSKIKQGNFRTALIEEHSGEFGNLYYVYQIDNFDMPQTWLFGTLGGGQTPAEAILFAMTWLSTLNNTPYPKQHYGMWVCEYGEDTGAMTIADDKGDLVAPSPEQAMSLLK
ncbi:MAG: hypothetical protein A3I12_01260 [Gammaproteobacteria bacterium RIFCSPLOWO2_02_FULL_38_11]|nr:MAG: hypothetical protein A3B69_03695 [Gammaproteobacteria bacterium RIFCSPHIGHO2_02_FULL_38_33]OGT24056.1 MAG: hypothetical protein A2W47_00265 [Gammaproteobacteria bacterium RIFCSPHIGHO2_12_38_15]OGT67581.1 MAG: hypothetical protein A3I12_01260 [Gammaproteobacteria bacterium RIFCSPLOWO2_02_FULL_38_11]